MENNTISINGKEYNPHTGMPLEDHPAQIDASSRHQTVAASSIHHRSQRSKTLRRKSLSTPTTSTKIEVKSTPNEISQHQRSAAISRFAPHPVVSKVKQPETADIPPQSHVLTDRVAQRTTQQSVTPPSAKEMKDKAIEKALASAKEEEPSRRRPRVFSMASGGLALLLLAGYLTYISMPSISMRIAAAQAGIDASYPTYQPSGYSLGGPITYADGQVSVAFVANAGPQNYTINERETTWDSSAVLENYVIPAWGENYTTHQQGGLTIYTYNSGAAWVNGGILYTIEGNAPLSEDQILKIAGSL